MWANRQKSIGDRFNTGDRLNYKKVIIILDVADFMEQWRGSNQSVFTNYQPSCWRVYDSTSLKGSQL